MNSWVIVTVRFAAVVPDNELDADTYADTISGRIVAAIPPLDYSIEDGSATVLDWIAEEV